MRPRNHYPKSLRDEVVHFYLTGENTLKELCDYYGLKYETVHSWVFRHRNREKGVSLPFVSKKSEDMSRKKTESPMDENEALKRRIKELEERLRFSELQNLALNTMIDIAEEQGIEIRKKSGARQ